MMTLSQFASPKRLAWLLVLESVVVIWGVNTLWQQKVEQQHTLQQSQARQQTWQQLEQSVRTAPYEFPVSLIEHKGQVMGMRLITSASLPEWAEMLEALQQRFWLAPEKVRWQRRGDQWEGDITWGLLRPRTLKPALNVLPLEVHVDPPVSGQLVSTVHAERPAALFAIHQQELWLHEGNWSPELRATVAKIDQDFVILQNAQGHSQRLWMTEVKKVALREEAYLHAIK